MYRQSTTAIQHSKAAGNSGLLSQLKNSAAFKGFKVAVICFGSATATTVLAKYLSLCQYRNKNPNTSSPKHSELIGSAEQNAIITDTFLGCTIALAAHAYSYLRSDQNDQDVSTNGKGIAREESEASEDETANIAGNSQTSEEMEESDRTISDSECQTSDETSKSEFETKNDDGEE